MSKTAPPWLKEPFWLHLPKGGTILAPLYQVTPFSDPLLGESSSTFEGGTKNSALVGAELHTMKQLQGWSCFGSTFFLSEPNL